MKRRSFILMVVISLIALSAVHNSWAQLKIGYIDTPKVLAEWEPAVEAQKKLESEANAAYMEVQKMEADIRDSQEKLEQQGLMYTEKKKNEKQKEIQDMVARWQEFQQTKQLELNKRREELFKPITDEINAAISKIGDGEGYDFILDTAQGILLHVKESHNLTDKLIAELKKKKSS